MDGAEDNDEYEPDYDASAGPSYMMGRFLQEQQYKLSVEESASELANMDVVGAADEQPPSSEQFPMVCASCGLEERAFSKTQQKRLRSGEPGSCMDCISSRQEQQQGVAPNKRKIPTDYSYGSSNRRRTQAADGPPGSPFYRGNCLRLTSGLSAPAKSRASTAELMKCIDGTSSIIRCGQSSCAKVWDAIPGRAEAVHKFNFEYSTFFAFDATERAYHNERTYYRLASGAPARNLAGAVSTQGHVTSHAEGALDGWVDDDGVQILEPGSTCYDSLSAGLRRFGPTADEAMVAEATTLMEALAVLEQYSAVRDYCGCGHERYFGEDKNYARVVKALRDNLPLQSLNLDHAGFTSCKDQNQGPRGIEHLSSALKTNTQLTALNLRDNRIDDTGAMLLADVLRTNTTLKSLDLRSCNIGRQGMQHFVRALDENIFSACEVLQLNFQTCDEEGDALPGAGWAKVAAPPTNESSLARIGLLVDRNKKIRAEYPRLFSTPVRNFISTFLFGSKRSSKGTTTTSGSGSSSQALPHGSMLSKFNKIGCHHASIIQRRIAEFAGVPYRAFVGRWVAEIEEDLLLHRLPPL